MSRRHWPADMQLGIDMRDLDVLTLLFVRGAWELDIDVIPPVMTPPPYGRSALPNHLGKAEAQQRWLVCWAAIGGAAVHRSEFGSSWQDRFGGEGIDLEALRAWRDSFIPREFSTLADEPETRVGDVIINAWHRGLRRIVEVPVAGLWDEAHRSTLLASAETRGCVDEYRGALLRFGQSVERP